MTLLMASEVFTHGHLDLLFGACDSLIQDSSRGWEEAGERGSGSQHPLQEYTFRKLSSLR